MENLGLKYERGPVTVTARANHFGSVHYKPTNEAHSETFGAKTLSDISASMDINSQVTLALGVHNVLNTFLDKHCNNMASAQNPCSNYPSGRFPYSGRVTQFGMNGGFYYARLHL